MKKDLQSYSNNVFRLFSWNNRGVFDTVKRFCCFLLLIFLGMNNNLRAQNDSLRLVAAKWKIMKLNSEVTWKQCQFKQKELFESNQHINLLELSASRKKMKLSIAYSDSLELTSQLAKKHRAIAGINGSFFLMRGKDPDNHTELTAVPHTVSSAFYRNRSQTYLKVDGKIIAENQPNSSIVKRYKRGVLAFGRKKISIFQVDTTLARWEHRIHEKNIITSGPMLLYEGQKSLLPPDAFCQNRHPRTAVGVRADGSVLLLVVDGRSSEAYGMNLYELQKIMSWLGCVDALNLDGGGSSTMFVSGQSYEGVVNCPSDNKMFDHEGEREVANALLILGK